MKRRYFIKNLVNTITYMFILLFGIYIGLLYAYNTCYSRQDLNWYEISHQTKTMSHMETDKDHAEPLLLIVIISAPRNFEIRKAIRETWLKQKTQATNHIFVIGTKFLNDVTVNQLDEEKFKYKDVVHLPNFVDSYEALTEKLLESFVFAYYERKFQYLLKVDDDSYVNLPLFHDKLKKLSIKEKLYWGFFDGRATPKQRGPWKETNWNLCDTYLPYALGGGYLISRDLVEYVVKNKFLLKRYNSEDISVGTWLAALDINKVHDPHFDTEYKSRGCNNHYIVSHKQTIFDLKEKFRNLKNHGTLCRIETKTRRSYIYNWNYPPSRCCLRNDSNIP